MHRLLPRIAALAAVLFLWNVTMALADDSPASTALPTKPHVITYPGLAKSPSPEEVRRLYPRQALQTGISGSAVIQCGVTVEGTATNCQVLDENPRGYGFGDAGLAILQAFRFTPQLYDGSPRTRVPSGCR